MRPTNPLPVGAALPRVLSGFGDGTRGGLRRRPPPQGPALLNLEAAHEHRRAVVGPSGICRRADPWRQGGSNRRLPLTGTPFSRAEDRTSTAAPAAAGRCSRRAKARSAPCTTATGCSRATINVGATAFGARWKYLYFKGHYPEARVRAGSSKALTPGAAHRRETVGQARPVPAPWPDTSD